MNDGGRLSQPGYKDIPDQVVEEFVAKHPSGASCEEIGQVMGMTRTRVGQILKSAITKCQRVCARRGVTVEDIPKHRETVWERLSNN